MDDLKGEAESISAEIGMSDGQVAGRQPVRQRRAQRSQLQRIARAFEHQRVVGDRNSQGHGDAKSDMLLQTRRAAKALHGVNNLRETVATRVDAGPDLATA